MAITNTQRETVEKQRVQNLEQEQLVGYWTKTLGLSKKALETHPCIDDVILLKNFRREFWDLPKFWKTPFQRIYKRVYEGKIPLKKRDIKELKRMTEGMIKWRQKRSKTTKKPRL